MVSVERTLKRGRRYAERLMTDMVVVSRRSALPVTDPVTQEVTYPTVTVYEGRGRVQSRNTEGKDFTNAGAAVLVVAFQAQIPVHVPLQHDDLIEVVDSESDPLMVGRVFRVDSVQRKTHATKTEANVEEVP